MSRLTIVALLLALAVSPIEAKRKPKVPEYRAFPPTHQSMIDQNVEIDHNHLQRIQNDSQLRELIGDGELVQIRTTPALRVNVPKGEAYVRPWVNDFLVELSTDFYARFGVPLQVNSAVRTAKVQRRLRLWNRNAAPVNGDTPSAHMAGVAVDLQRRKLTPVQKWYVQMRLLYWYSRGRVLVEEELKYPCFHVVVRTGYNDIELEPVTVPGQLDQLIPNEEQVIDTASKCAPRMAAIFK